MRQKNSDLLKKTIKIAAITCVALGGTALLVSGAALKALAEGAKCLNNTVRKIMKEDAEAEAVYDVTAAEEVFAEAPVAAEGSAAEEGPRNLV